MCFWDTEDLILADVHNWNFYNVLHLSYITFPRRFSLTFSY